MSFKLYEKPSALLGKYFVKMLQHIEEGFLVVWIIFALGKTFKIIPTNLKFSKFLSVMKDLFLEWFLSSE